MGPRRGRWVWRWKHWIDSRFMNRFQTLPDMPLGRGQGANPGAAPGLHPESSTDENMRCGGCGAKVGADVLAAALADHRNGGQRRCARRPGCAGRRCLDFRTADRLSVLSVDAFRPMFPDPYLFGRITAITAWETSTPWAPRPGSHGPGDAAGMAGGKADR